MRLEDVVNGAIGPFDNYADGSIQPLFMRKRADGVEIPIYSVEPLLQAGQALFGTAEQRRFPILPGAHVNCAVKNCTVVGPMAVWSAIALAIAVKKSPCKQGL